MSVSVALATYDGERHLAAQVRSILTQERRPDEIVVSDDGSTDGTLRLLEELRGEAREAGVEFRILPPGPRLGVTANFARALAATSGEYVALCDQDDLWYPDRISAAVAALDADPAALLHHADADLVDEAGASLGGTLFGTLPVRPAEKRLLLSGRALPALLRRNLVTGATVLVRRRLLQEAAPFPAEWVHDEWLAALAAAREGTRTLDRSLIAYRQHGANQIGVQRLTVRRKIERMLAVRPDRHVLLARRARQLEARLSALGASEQSIAAVRGKRVFEERRAEYPAGRLLRVPAILAGLARGDYGRYSSQGALDAVRDLLAPAAEPSDATTAPSAS